MLIVRIWKPQKWVKKIKITHNPLPPLTFRCMCVYIDISSFLPFSLPSLTGSCLFITHIHALHSPGEENNADHMPVVLGSGGSPQGLWEAGFLGTSNGVLSDPHRRICLVRRYLFFRSFFFLFLSLVFIIIIP